MIPPPPRSTLFPYTTLFRSLANRSTSVPFTTSLRVTSSPIISVGISAASTVVRASGSHHALNSEKRSEEHTSELQSQFHLVCRLLLEKKNCHPPTPYRRYSP